MGGEPVSDSDLVRRMRRGDEGALEALYLRYAGLVHTLALRIVGDPELAREVLQDTFLRSWDGRDTYDPAKGRVAWWLMGIARNRAIDLLRSRSHQARLREREARPSPLLVAEATPDPGDVVSDRRVVVGALAGLSSAQRETIELAYYQGLTQAEIADKLGQPLGTIKSRMREAMERLRAALRSLIDFTGDVKQ